MSKKFECQPNLARPCPALLCVCWSSLEPEMQKPLFWNEMDCNFWHAAIPSLLWLPWHPSPLHFFTWHTCRYMVMVWCGFVSRIALDICPLYSPIHGPLDEIQWGSGWLWYKAEIALASLLRVKLAQPRISTSRCSIFASPPPPPNLPLFWQQAKHVRRQGWKIPSKQTFSDSFNWRRSWRWCKDLLAWLELHHPVWVNCC